MSVRKQIIGHAKNAEGGNEVVSGVRIVVREVRPCVGFLEAAHISFIIFKNSSRGSFLPYLVKFVDIKSNQIK